GYFASAQYDKIEACHSERSEKSQQTNRDISLPLNMTKEVNCHSEPKAEESKETNITLTQNQIAFSKYPAFIYILTNKNNTTLYIGVTSNLQKRIYEHKNHLVKGFSDKYNCEKLVYFESFDNINQAIEREKYLKGKKRDFKENLINSINPKWLDLYDYLFSCPTAPCHSERSEESQQTNRDISLPLNMTNSGACHSEGFIPEESKRGYFASAQYDKIEACHSEHCEESLKDSKVRDISHFSNAQYDKIEACHSERSEESKNTQSQPLELVKMVSLGEVCEKIFAGGDLPKEHIKGKAPSEEFLYPIYSNGSDENSLYGFSKSYKVDTNAVTISARGTIGFHTTREANFTPIVRLITLIPKTEKITNKFLNYALYATQIEKMGTNVGIPQLTIPMLAKIQIPLPPLEVQNAIVAILDKFDCLVNDLSKGIPAEIKARRQQYEYYREKLLSFKRLEKSEG
ncbi:restriction endonuclease subunit S, partial [Helicobacter himalayensis]|uniref:restriction endonuclease subunit S n=1 Tax=Helicobacter himalayensis TaxID=1591088 RepID=UPI003D6FA1E5